MSGIVGSYFNTRGSGLVAKLGTDGQVFTSSGAGVSQAFEAAAGGGKIGQVVSALKTDTVTTTSDTYVTTGLEVTITPTDTSSKVYLIVGIGSLGQRYSAYYTHVIIDGGNCATYIGDGSFQSASSVFFNNDGDQQIPAQMMYLDSPATTSATTYAVHFCEQSGGTATFNRTYDQDAWSGGTASTITAMEILA